jgi:glyoxylase-like metal-dependent hydrolase (beta-lactamase superfamily II)
MGTFWAGVPVSKFIVRGAIGFVLATCRAARLVPDVPDGRSDLVSQAACGSLVPASQGGPMPTGNVATLRWLGTSNYELAYHGKIVIMDTFYERPARTASLGFTVGDVRKADVILIGYAHADHISDVAPVAAQTGAPVIGSAITTAQAIALGVPKAQTVTVVGNEALRYGDISIRPTHIVHSTIEGGSFPRSIRFTS